MRVRPHTFWTSERHSEIPTLNLPSTLWSPLLLCLHQRLTHCDCKWGRAFETYGGCIRTNSQLRDDGHLDKREVSKTWLKFLEHFIDSQEVTPVPDGAQAIKDYPLPKRCSDFGVSSIFITVSSTKENSSYCLYGLHSTDKCLVGQTR